MTLKHISHQTQDGLLSACMTLTTTNNITEWLLVTHQPCTAEETWYEAADSGRCHSNTVLIHCK